MQQLSLRLETWDVECTVENRPGFANRWMNSSGTVHSRPCVQPLEGTSAQAVACNTFLHSPLPFESKI